MGKPLPAVRRISLVIDIEGYSKRTAPEQVDAQGRLMWVVVNALRAAGVSPTDCERQDQGDGQLIMLPPGINEAHALPTIIMAMHSALHEVNEVPGLAGRLRMRLALAQGPVQIAAMGYVGVGVVAACRMLDSDPPRQALKRHPAADLVTIVSDDLYHQVFSQEYTAGLSARDFQPVQVLLRSKGYQANAYLHVSGATPARGLVPDFTGAYEEKPSRFWLAAIPTAAVGVGAGLWLGYEVLHDHDHDHDLLQAALDEPIDHRLSHGEGVEADPQDPADPALDWPYDPLPGQEYDPYASYADPGHEGYTDPPTDFGSHGTDFGFGDFGY